MKVFKKKIKKISIVYRSNSLKGKKKSEEIQTFLKEKNIECHILPHTSIKKPLQKSIDMILSLGGDGTYLKAAHYGKDKKVPVLGIHMGSLGFLTPHHEKNIFPVLEKALLGKLFLKKNHFISIELYHIKQSLSSIEENFIKTLKLKKPDKTFQAINDVVIERGSLSHLISIEFYVNKQYVYSTKADGLIVASPLGSTAYNLAAGGPILHPKVNSFVVTPICSHSLTNRPLIIHDKDTIHLHLKEKRGFLTIDGIVQNKLSPHHILSIKKDKHSFFSLTEKKETEFLLLREKLKFGQRD